MSGLTRGGDSGAADAELRGQLALRWGVAGAVAGMQVDADDRVGGRRIRTAQRTQPWLIDAHTVAIAEKS